jgi:hypothetical protein
LIEQFYHEIHATAFQQDNAPSYKARLTKAELIRRGVNLVWWPPYSPDLSAIENVWFYLKAIIEATAGTELQQLTKPALRQILLQAWEAVPEDLLLRLSRGMPERLRKCIAAGGEAINY